MKKPSNPGTMTGIIIFIALVAPIIAIGGWVMSPSVTETIAIFIFASGLLLFAIVLTLAEVLSQLYGIALLIYQSNKDQD